MGNTVGGYSGTEGFAVNPLKAVGLAKSALGHCTAGAMRSVGNGEAIDVSTTLFDMCRRDWAVRVLDACGVKWRNNVPSPIPVHGETRWVVVLPMHIGAKYGDTPDAARLAAAEAIWPELPESVRAELGERP